MKPLMQRDQERRPWPLILGLCLACTVGLASLPLQVATFRNLNTASKADVDRAADLTAQLAAQQTAQAADAKTYREDTRTLILSICDQIEAVAAQTRLQVPPCPRVATSPSTPSPTPSGP